MTNTMTQPTLKIRINNNNTMDMDIKRAVLNRPIHIKVILTKTIKTLDKIMDICYNKL